VSNDDKMPADVLRFPDGEPMIVLRPESPAEVVALASVALKHQSDEAMRQAYDRPLQFLGYFVKRKGKYLAVDANGQNPVEIRPGDVFAAPGDCYKPD